MKRRAFLGAAALATSTAGCLRLTGSGGDATATRTDEAATAQPGQGAEMQTASVSTDSTTDSAPNGGAGRLFAFDRDGGDALWTFEAPADGMHGHVQQLATDGTRVFAGSDDDGSGDDQRPLVFALDAESGEQRYVVDDLPATFVNDVFHRNGTLYVSLVNGELHTFAAEGGERTGTYSVPFGFGRPAVVGREMYAPGSEVLAFDLSSNTRRWTASLPSGASTRPAVRDDTVYVGTEAGHVLALDRASGEVRWQARTTAEVHSLVVGPTAVWVSDESSTVYAYAANDGTELLREESEDESDRPLAVVGDLLFVGGYSASIQRVEGRSGDSLSTTETWSDRNSPNHLWVRDGAFFGARGRDVLQYDADGPTGLTFGPLSDQHIAVGLVVDGARAFVGSRWVDM